VLGVLLGYSFVKRFSALAHAVLGLALAHAPLGAWIAVRGSLEGDLVPVLGLALAVWTWVFGFDLIYACQDVEFDRAQGLHSIPARYGVRTALGLSALLHVATVAFLVFTWWSADLSWVYGLAIALSAALLVWEHGLVRPDDLSRVNVAFFTVNGWIGVGLFVGLALDPDLGRIGEGV
jgi:4-hydroxybenzoate polyprenyltransferase